MTVEDIDAFYPTRIGRENHSAGFDSTQVFATINGVILRRTWMANEKRFMAWKRHHRKRKSSKAKMKLYEEGKIPHDKLPALAKRFLSRKLRFLTKAE
jgi:hypothetical protein